MAAVKHRNPVYRPLIKFAIYTVICLVLLFVLAVRVGNLSPPTQNRDTYTAVLSNADSLVAKDDVKIAGVTVGQVHKVSVFHGQAIVRFSLDHSIRLRDGTAAGLRWQNIIGAKYLYLYPSTTGVVLARGARLTNEVEGADVGDFLMDIGGFLKALNPSDINAFTSSIVQSLQDNEAQVGQLVDNTATVTANLGNQSSDVGQIVDNLNNILTALEGRDADLAAVINHLSSVASDLASRNDVIDDLIANFTDVNGDLSQLVTNNATNVNQITANLQTVASVLQQHTSQLDAGLTTASAGLAPYIEISKLGQWFSIRVVYACLADETTCVYDQPANEPTTLNNPPYNPVPGSAAGAETAAQSDGPSPTANPATASANPATASADPATASTDPGSLPIGPPAPRASVSDIVGFAMFGDEDPMNLTERNPLIIGLIAIVFILAGTFAALTIKSTTFSPTYSLSANFPDAAGLQGGDLVTIAGVQVGHIGSIKQDGNTVLVSLKMNHGVQVAIGSTAAIKVATLLGRMEVALTPQADANWSDLFEKGQHIPGLGGSPTQVLDVQSDAQTALATLDASAVNNFLADLANVTSGKADQVSSIINGLNKLTSTVNARSGEVSSLIDAANAVSGTVEANNENLLSAIDNLNSVVANLDARHAELTALLTSTETSASQTASLIGNNRTQLTQVLNELESSLNVINAHQVDLAQTISYAAGAVEGFSSVGYSGAEDTPNSWANIFLVGVGPATGDPVFGCDGELDLLLTEIVGPDPVTNCQQYTGPVPGGTTAGVAGTAPAGADVKPSTRNTADALNALLVPFFAGAGTP